LDFTLRERQGKSDSTIWNSNDPGNSYIIIVNLWVAGVHENRGREWQRLVENDPSESAPEGLLKRKMLINFDNVSTGVSGASGGTPGNRQVFPQSA
jgi:hypothetical protein